MLQHFAHDMLDSAAHPGVSLRIGLAPSYSRIHWSYTKGPMGAEHPPPLGWGLGSDGTGRSHF